MREELGDLLLQVYFHARIAEEDPNDPFSLDDVARGIADKLIARHPHVFGDEKVDNSGDVLENWEKIKNREKGRTSAHDGVPIGQPALPLAAKLIYRAEKNRLPIPEIPDRNINPDAETIGEELMRIISLAVQNGIDPEVALRKAALSYRNSIGEAESR